MKIGVLLECEEGLTWRLWREAAKQVETLGFESLWLSDHLLSPHDPNREALETWTALAVAAAETSQVRLGSLVTPVTFRHPSLLAKMAASLDVLSEGRMVLGVGAGWNAVEHATFGLPFPPTATRMDQLEEALVVLSTLLEADGQPATIDGRFYRLAGAELHPKPPQRPRVPLLIGGMGERRLLPLVARFADEWNLTTNSPEVVRAKSRRLAECCRQIGRDPASIRCSVSVGLLAGRDTPELLQRAARMQRLLPSLGTLTVSEVPQAAQAMGWLVGRPNELVEQLRAVAAAGVQRVMLNHYDFQDPSVLELIAETVMPLVQSDR